MRTRANKIAPLVAEEDNLPREPDLADVRDLGVGEVGAVDAVDHRADGRRDRLKDDVLHPGAVGGLGEPRGVRDDRRLQFGVAVLEDRGERVVDGGGAVRAHRHAAELGGGAGPLVEPPRVGHNVVRAGARRRRCGFTSPCARDRRSSAGICMMDLLL